MLRTILSVLCILTHQDLLILFNGVSKGFWNHFEQVSSGQANSNNMSPQKLEKSGITQIFHAKIGS